MKAIKFLTFGVIAFLFFPSLSWGGAVITYHGRLVHKNGATPLHGNYTFLIQIRSPGNNSCLLYEEQRSVNIDQGVFVIPIGDRQDTRTPDDKGIAIEKVFANDGVTISGLSCHVTGDTYKPQALDQRQLVVKYFDHGLSNWDALPTVNLGHVPFAVSAHDSQQIGGAPAKSVLRVKKDQTVPSIDIDNFTNGDVLGWNGTSWIPVAPSAGAPTMTATSPLSISGSNISLSSGSTAGNVLTWNGSNWVSQALPTGNVGTVTEVTGDKYISVTTGTSTPALSANIGQTSGTLVAGDDSRFGTLDAGLTGVTTDITNLQGLVGTLETSVAGKITAPAAATCSAGQVLTFTAPSDWGCTSVSALGHYLPLAGGTMSGGLDMGTKNITNATNITATGNITTSGVGSTVSGSIGSFSSLKIYDGVSQYLIFTLPTGGTGYNLKWPNTVGANGSVLQTDNSGNLSWVVPPTAPVASVAGKTGVVTLTNADITGLGTAAVENVGTAAGNVVQLDTNGKLPAIDGSQLTNLPAGNPGTVTSITAGTGLKIDESGTAITGAGTLSVNIGTGVGSVAAGDDGRFTTLADGIATLTTGLASANTAIGTKITNPATCGLGQVLTFTAPLDWACTSVSGAMGNQAANKVYAGPETGADAAPSFRGLVEADIPSLAAGKITTGTFDAARLPAFSGDVVSTAGTASLKIAGQTGNTGKYLTTDGTSVSWGTVSTEDATKLPLAGGTMTGNITHSSGIGSIYTAGNGNNVKIQAPANVTANYVLRLPAAVPAANDQALVSDTSGNLSWKTLSSGSVTGVTGTLPVVVTGTTAPVISVNDATTTTKGVVQVGAGIAVTGGVIKADPANFDSLVPVAKGGTNSGTALLNNRVMISSGSKIVEAPAIIANRALISDANGLPVASAITNTQLGYLSTLSGDILTLLNQKVSKTQVASCNADQTLSYISATDTWSCIAINNLDANKITAGTLPVARGGTGATSFTGKRLLASDTAGTKIIPANITVSSEAAAADFGIGGNPDEWQRVTIHARTKDRGPLGINGLTNGEAGVTVLRNGTWVGNFGFVEGSNIFTLNNNIPFSSNGGFNFEVNGTAKVIIAKNGNIDTRGDIDSDGTMWANGDLGTGAELYVTDDATIDGDLTVKKNIIISGVGLPAGTQALHVDGNIVATGTITPSDIRLKENIKEIQNPLEKILSLHGVEYDWRTDIEQPMKRTQRHDFGVIAQEVEVHFPEAVHSVGGEYKGVDYSKLVSPIIAAIKELYEMLLGKADRAEVLALEERVKEAEKENAEKDQKISELEERLSRLEKHLSGH